MKSLYLFGSLALLFGPIFLDFNDQSLKICWGLGLLLFAMFSLRFVLGLIALVGGPMLVLPLFDNGNEFSIRYPRGGLQKDGSYIVY